MQHSHKVTAYERERVSLYSRTAVVPLHAQRLAPIGRLQQPELQQDGLVQVSAHKRLVVVDGDRDHRGVHCWVSGKPERKERRGYRVTRRPRK